MQEYQSTKEKKLFIYNEKKNVFLKKNTKVFTIEL